MEHRGCTPFCERNAPPWQTNFPEVAKKGVGGKGGGGWQVRQHWQTCLLFIFFLTPQVPCVSHTIACKVTVLQLPSLTAAMVSKWQFFLCRNALARVCTSVHFEGKSYTLCKMARGVFAYCRCGVEPNKCNKKTSIKKSITNVIQQCNKLPILL